MAKPEDVASKRVRVAASLNQFRLFRNNNGVLRDKYGTPVHFGLGNEPIKSEGKKLNQHFKSGDYVGWRTVEITPEMVGKTVAIFSNIEVKPDGKLESTLKKALSDPTSREGLQKRFIDMVQSAGGISGFCTNETDVDKLISEFISRLKE